MIGGGEQGGEGDVLRNREWRGRTTLSRKLMSAIRRVSRTRTKSPPPPPAHAPAPASSSPPSPAAAAAAAIPPPPPPATAPPPPPHSPLLHSVRRGSITASQYGSTPPQTNPHTSTSLPTNTLSSPSPPIPGSRLSIPASSTSVTSPSSTRSGVPVYLHRRICAATTRFMSSTGVRSGSPSNSAVMDRRTNSQSSGVPRWFGSSSGL